METRISGPFLVPPSDWICDMLRVGAEITIEFVSKIGFCRGRKCRQFVKYVFSRGRALKEKKTSVLSMRVKKKNTY